MGTTEFVHTQPIEHETIATIIRTIEAGGTTQTELMYEANLSRDQIEGYMECMQENGLLSCVERETIEAHASSSYKLTQKGLHFLHVYDEMNDLLTP
jgi:predicted transcriptional regulator